MSSSAITRTARATSLVRPPVASTSKLPALPSSRKKRNAKRLATNRLRHADLDEPRILFESPGLLGVFKPASYAIQGDDRRANSQKWHMFVSALEAGYGDVYAVDRLEAGTSGALVFARNVNQSKRLQKLVERKGFDKTFVALVVGDLERSEAWPDSPLAMMSDGSVGRRVTGYFRKDADKIRRCSASDSEAQEVVTDISVIETSEDGRFRLLRVEPRKTIRHGLRVQMAVQLKAPIVGDYKYGDVFKHKTFDYLKYQGSFSLALHCLDVTVPTYSGSRRNAVRADKGVYAEPDDDFAKACAKAGIQTLLETGLRFGGPSGKWTPSKDPQTIARAARAADPMQAWYGAPTPSKPSPLRKEVRAPDVQLQPVDTTPFDRLFANHSLATQATALEVSNTEEERERRRLARQRFDPARRLAEATEPHPTVSTSLTPYMPSSPTALKMGRTKLLRETSVVEAGRMPPGAIVGMMELRRRRVAAKRALARGEKVAKNRAPMRAIQRKPFVGISAEYTPQKPSSNAPQFSSRQTAKARAKMARQTFERPGPPGSDRAASTVRRSVKARQRDRAAAMNKASRARGRGHSSVADIYSASGKPKRIRAF